MALSRTALQEIAEGYRHDYEEYQNAVLSGSRLASRAEILKVKRQINDMENGVDGYVWDWNYALKPLVWIAVNLKFPLGIKRGKPAFLSPFQVWDVATLFGWVTPDTHERRWFNSYFEIARKNGKSVLAGFLCDYFAFGDGSDGVDCYIAATSLDQAEETFKRAADSLALGKHRNIKIANSKNNKLIEWKSSRIRAISNAPKDGKLAYFTVIDEYHQHKDNNLIDSILSGNVSDQQSHMMRITTAGTELNSVCHEEYEKCMRILSGEIEARHYFVSIYEANEGANVGDIQTWMQANPNLGESVSIKNFQGIYENARPSEKDMITFRTKNLNMWVRGSSRWANMTIWGEKCHWTVPEESLYGQPCYCGLDLSSTYDFTAFSADFPTDRGHVILTHCWIAENQVEAISRQCRIPLRQWIADGYVSACSGDVISYEDVADWLSDFYSKHAIERIACDRWHIDRLESLMPSWFSEVAFEFSQGMRSMDQALGKFERAYLQGEITENCNQMMDWMMSCADTKTDGNNQKLIKPNKSKHSTRIDGVITSLMAYDSADTMTAQEEPVAPTDWTFF